MKEMNVLLMCNEAYVNYVMVLLQSLYDNHTDVCIHTYLIYTSGKDESYNKLESFVTATKVHTIELVQIDIELGNLKTSNYFPMECYYSLFPQLYLPDKIDRVLYLDVDTIVGQNIFDFYCEDFGNNYLIACGQSYQWKKPENLQRPAIGGFGYFNSGVIIYNLELLRKEVPLEKYSYVLEHSEQFFFDQGMLNYLFYDKTKYEETLKYNFRCFIAFTKFKDISLKMLAADQVAIVHYTCDAQPYKPWDFYIEDETFFNKYQPSVYEKGYMRIDKDINRVIGIWWKYAKRTPIYEILHHDMEVKRAYILRNSIHDKINSSNRKIDDFVKTWGYVKRRNSECADTEKRLGCSYLQAVNNYYGVTEIACDLQKVVTLEEYFDLFRKKEKYLMVISCKDTCEKYFQLFAQSTGYDLKKPSYRESYIALISSGEGVIYEKNHINEQVHRFNYGIPAFSLNAQLEKGKVYIDIPKICSEQEGLVTSCGYNAKEKISFSEIVINNINYSMNNIGLNFVVIDTENGVVMDSFNINTHNDGSLKLIRNS